MNLQLSLRKRLTNMTAAVLVLALSLLLLAYVGIAEAYRTYPRFEIDKLAAQGEVVKNPIETFLVAGLPLEQFPGFLTLTQPLLASDRSISQVRVTNTEAQVTFVSTQPKGNVSAYASSLFVPSKLQDKESHYQIVENDSFYQVILPLQNKFEKVGQLEMAIGKAAIAQQINTHFAQVAIAIVFFLLLYALLAFFGYRRWKGQGSRVLDISYGFIFLVVAIIVTVSLTHLYAQGIKGKTRALAHSLTERLNAALELNLDLSNFEGLNEAFADYQKINPDISFIALTSNDRLVLHTDPKRIGTSWKPQPDNYEYDINLNAPNSGSLALHVAVRIGIPKQIIYAKLWRSVKNFFVLFVASGFLAVLFSKLLRSFTGQSQEGLALAGSESTVTLPYRHFNGASLFSTNSAQLDFQLSLIEPLYFLGVFVEALNVSFLPQYFKKLATVASANPSLVSTLFTVYFAFFVLALLPAGRYAQVRGVKQLLIWGVMLSALGMLLMAFVMNFYAMFAIRAIAGFGQGVLYIGVQSYILELATNEKKTQGAAIIVFGYNSGMISGTAIGSLLATYLGTQGVFAIAGLTALFALWYAQQLIPPLQIEQKVVSQQRKTSTPTWIDNLLGVVKDFQFVSSMLLIGIPAKGILTGVTIFALPLLLSRQNYAQEDIGQILMFYGAGVLISSRYISRLVDRIGKVGGILCLGTLGSGLGLVLIGLIGWNQLSGSQFSYLSPLLLIMGMTTLGLAHGFIHAPIVTYVTDSQAGGVLGKSPVASLYRLLERLGHVMGPILVGQLLLVNNESAFTISWLGIATIVSGLIFALGLRWKRVPSQG